MESLDELASVGFNNSLRREIVSVGSDLYVRKPFLPYF